MPLGQNRSEREEVEGVRAVVLSEFGPPEVLVPRDVPDPVAEPGQALIDVEIANRRRPAASVP
jgi:hypothetical protein